MTMFDVTFDVKAVPPSGVITCSDGKLTATRKFVVKSQYAEELGIRLLGKWSDFTYDYPVLPARFPSISDRVNLVAKGFTIEPQSACCFTNSDAETVREFIDDLESVSQMEKYYLSYSDDTEDCVSVVEVSYGEPDWDCDSDDNLLAQTAISSQINPAYEMFTLPSRNLVWEGASGADKNLKDDSYAYKIIPKSDIIISWHNVAVADLCKIHHHLAGYRGKVNLEAWGDMMYCGVGSVSDSGACQLHPAETVMFIDFEEDRSKRTNGYTDANKTIDMNTTTLKLHFKLKNIKEDNITATVFGWNHLFRDKPSGGVSGWTRVKQIVNTIEYDLFEKKSFTSILNPTL